jgi:hypothetical protein
MNCYLEEMEGRYIPEHEYGYKIGKRSQMSTYLKNASHVKKRIALQVAEMFQLFINSI